MKISAWNPLFIVRLIYSSFVIFTFFLLLGDSFYNPSSSLKYFYVDSRFLYTIFIISDVVLKLFNRQLLFDRLIKFNNKFIFPLTTSLFLLLAVTNGFTYQNFVFNTFALNLEIFKYLFYVSGYVLLSNIKADWLISFKQRLLYFGGILFLMVMSLFSAFYLDFYKALLQEDGLFENMQVGLYLVSSFIGLAICSRLIKAGRRSIAGFFLLLSILLFFIAGEEISWGQRIFNINTPAELAKVNLQGEITVHNIRPFQVQIDYIYMAVGLWGAFGWLFARKFFPQFFKKYYLLFPHPIIFFYFFAVSRYYFLNKFVVFNYQLFSFEKMGIGDRQELPETVLAFGFLCYMLLTRKELSK